MSITYDKTKRFFSLHTNNSTYQFMADSHGYFLHLYYGKRNEAPHDYLLTYIDRGFSGNPHDAGTDRTYSLDVLPQEYPTLGTGDYRNTALMIKNPDGSRDCDLRYKSHRIIKGKYTLQGLPAAYANEEADTLEVVTADARTGAEVTLLYGVIPDCDVITRSVRVKNTGEGEMTICRIYSACLDLLPGKRDLISFYGRHMMERNPQRTRLVHGTFEIGSNRGTSSHQYNPLFIVTDADTTEHAGNAYALSFVYSGGFEAKAELDQYNQVRLLMGVSDEGFAYPLPAGKTFEAPEVVMSYTSQGLTSLSHNLHDVIRHHICRGPYQNRPRPILVNSWEASYFHFDGKSLLKLADRAAALGMEMLVMDDGWFGEREDDNTSLGDWTVNEKKLGCSLASLAEQVKKRGLMFGLWIEPEMVSEESCLYRNHPEWALQIPGKKPIRSRNQLVLDFSNREAVEFVFEGISKVLTQAEIHYVKWDMNRSLADVYSSATSDQGRVLYDYVLGVYDLAERLTTAFPDVLWEGCAGGGGRFDMGMLYYTPQIWCSDNTDALDRCLIQYGTSFGYPLSTISSHVSAVPNHQTGRTVSIKTRGIVAMTGAFGYELDLNQLTPDEEKEIKEQILLYKELTPLLINGDYYRLSNPAEDEYTAFMVADREKENVYCVLVFHAHHANSPVIYIKPTGLNPEATYRDMETNRLYSGLSLTECGLPVIMRNGDYPTYTWRFRAEK